jgi:hypothetical protein
MLVNDLMLTYASASKHRRAIPENRMESTKMKNSTTLTVAGFGPSGIDRE